ncbi:Alpha/Beta hydrolase protein [Cercophora scortea]|uniref:Alpha/Beta hydrolase protein n=1 Tax=Cercophora scortea TaxID=314031 RepID=A0AAE0M3F7_9PEZI|nr:Alpha/Beta hydrolase protein [Cercophora scortea]
MVRFNFNNFNPFSSYFTSAGSTPTNKAETTTTEQKDHEHVEHKHQEEQPDQVEDGDNLSGPGEEQGELITLRYPTEGYPKLDIVAVHGLDGHHLDSWTHNPQSPDATMWLRDLLPAKLPGARIMTFSYDASVIGNTSAHGIRANSEKLVNLLRNERDDIEDKDRPIVFIGHSLGGIIIKQAIRKVEHDKEKGPDMADIAKSIKGMVFFGTPHRGADSAKWLALLSSIAAAATNKPKSEFATTLQTNSEDLMKISEDFRPIAHKYAVASFYEEHAHRLLGTVVVEKTSAVMGLNHEESMMLGGTHSSMCKFKRGDRRFDPVWRAIRRASKGRGV